ncbi:putative transmembrane protein [Gregarina niphandrodes]|uniref:Transmembrane protein n=1 Tax=Gregarina niphandrodes TaxID=110365 RepID=A0A023B0M2_GRENI|nr:putative transmembrane protein [Gregarina niphandrodes]EZG45215.1 putative transmembrane protein [Gregarina niphandrodes]|eukprot:XP_011132542.1 putative transmembrane protein [Gregarina niphandrodes]
MGVGERSVTGKCSVTGNLVGCLSVHSLRRQDFARECLHNLQKHPPIPIVTLFFRPLQSGALSIGMCYPGIKRSVAIDQITQRLSSVYFQHFMATATVVCVFIAVTVQAITVCAALDASWIDVARLVEVPVCTGFSLFQHGT